MRGSGALAVGAVAAACAATALAAAPAADEVRDCRTRGELGRPMPAQHGVRLGPLVFGGAIASAAAGSRTDDPDHPFLFKAPVFLPAGTRVVLVLAPDAAARAAFPRSRRPGFVTAVRFEACRASQPAFSYRGTVGGTTFFPFSIALAARSGCLPLEVRVDGRAGLIRRVVPVGRRAC